MIFQFIRKKLHQKQLHKCIQNNTRKFNTSKIKRIGIILNTAEKLTTEDFNSFFASINLDTGVHLVINYSNTSKEITEHVNYSFNAKHFSIFGRITSEALSEFVNTPFDVLISYFKTDCNEINLITAQSKAHFKIGLMPSNTALNDLIIDVNPKDISVFTTEFKKYLTTLNKL